MAAKLASGFAAFCVATVMTQLILMGYFVSRGTFTGDTMTQVIALMNGIDITGDRLQRILKQDEIHEQPDFDEILEARKLDSLDMDMRLRSENEMRDEIATMLADLTVKQERFDQRRQSFDQRLEELKQGAQEEGLRQLQRILQSLDAVQAKEQLLTMYEDERIDDVVNIVQAMSTEKRKDILAEFVSKDETDKLAEILRRIGEGEPTTTLINQARGGL